VARRRVLPRAFYARPTLEVAADLLGKVLVHDEPGARTSGVIVEVEAYIGEDDPACHAAPGPTPRNAPLYGPPGVAYVYFNYGMHHLVNAVTEPEGQPAAVLIRALAPLEGLATMRARRASARRRRAAVAAEPPPVPDAALCRGPGNLTCALGLDARHNRLDLVTSVLRIEDHGCATLDGHGPAAWGTRIGIRVGVEHEWRAYVRGHPCVSG
jgi:DNA-3-methyladenine glycosylase